MGREEKLRGQVLEDEAVRVGLRLLGVGMSEILPKIHFVFIL